jgi:hypothetical protein
MQHCPFEQLSILSRNLSEGAEGPLPTEFTKRCLLFYFLVCLKPSLVIDSNCMRLEGQGLEVLEFSHQSYVSSVLRNKRNLHCADSLSAATRNTQGVKHYHSLLHEADTSSSRVLC